MGWNLQTLLLGVGGGAAIQGWFDLRYPWKCSGYYEESLHFFVRGPTYWDQIPAPIAFINSDWWKNPVAKL